MAKPHLELVSPATVKRTVAMPLRRPNAELRTREYLTDAEIGRLTDAAKANRYGHRDATIILLVYRHGLRASELVDLRWDQVDFNAATLAVRRAKKGTPSTHPIRGDELRMLTALRKEFPDTGYVFTTERGTPFTTDAVNRLVKTIGKRAKLSLPVHCHMLRHACGYALANRGVDTRAIQDWLGHVSITHTTKYTELSPVRFKDFWRD